jgi:hypothetical protein
MGGIREAEVKCGVPQARATGELGFVLFADDTNLFAEGQDPAGLFERVNGGWVSLASGSGVIGLL